MRTRKDNLLKHVRKQWDKNWKIPSADLGAVFFVFAIFGLFFLWFSLSVFGVEAEAVKAAHRHLPPWFFFANLFFGPVLGALAAAPFRVHLMLRLLFAALMLCSGSLFVVTREHQFAGLAMGAFLYLEAFWLIPRWRKWHERKWASRSR